MTQDKIRERIAEIINKEPLPRDGEKREWANTLAGYITEANPTDGNMAKYSEMENRLARYKDTLENVKKHMELVTLFIETLQRSTIYRIVMKALEE